MNGLVSLKVIFFTSGFFLFGVYLLYPAFLVLLSALFKKDSYSIAENNNDRELSKISVIISAYNEDKVIKQRIDNIISLDYPNDKLELIIVDDCSSDGTYDIVRKCVENNVNIKFLSNEQRMGKTASLNKAVAEASGDLLLMTDANTVFSKNVARKLERHFLNSKVGGARGVLVIKDKMDQKVPVLSENETVYWNLDMKMSMYEWNLGSCINMPGAIYMIRKELYKEIPEDCTIMDDFFESISVLKNKYSIALESEAIAFEYNSADKMGEYKRKIRISAANFNIVKETLPLLNIFKYKQVSFFMLWHKILRWYSFVFLSLFTVSSFLTAYFSRGVFYSVILFLLVLFFYFAALGFLFDNIKIKPLRRICGVSLYFLMINLAQILGFKMSLKSTKPYWERVERQI